jgi:hypothetical protein
MINLTGSQEKISFSKRKQKNITVCSEIEGRAPHT